MSRKRKWKDFIQTRKWINETESQRWWILIVFTEIQIVFQKCECRRDPVVLPECLSSLSPPVWGVETAHFHREEALHAQLKLGFWEGLKSSEFYTAGLWAVTQRPRNRGNHESPQPPFVDSGLWILNRSVHPLNDKKKRLGLLVFPIG